MVRTTLIRLAASSVGESSKSTRGLYESLSEVGALWPRDAVRPETSFGQSIVRASEKALTSPSPNAAPPPQTSSSQGVPTRINSKQLQFRTLENGEEEKVKQALHALNQIRNGSASKQYPVPESALRPASNPIYYERLAKMLAQAAKGNRTTLTFAQRVRLFFGLSI